MLDEQFGLVDVDLGVDRSEVRALQRRACAHFDGAGVHADRQQWRLVLHYEARAGGLVGDEPGIAAQHGDMRGAGGQEGQRGLWPANDTAEAVRAAVARPIRESECIAVELGHAAGGVAFRAEVRVSFCVDRGRRQEAAAGDEGRYVVRGFGDG